jgi:hypothetical protein
LDNSNECSAVRAISSLKPKSYLSMRVMECLDASECNSWKLRARVCGECVHHTAYCAECTVVKASGKHFKVSSTENAEGCKSFTK